MSEQRGQHVISDPGRRDYDKLGAATSGAGIRRRTIGTRVRVLGGRRRSRRGADDDSATSSPKYSAEWAAAARGAARRPGVQARGQDITQGRSCRGASGGGRQVSWRAQGGCEGRGGSDATMSADPKRIQRPVIRLAARAVPGRARGAGDCDRSRIQCEQLIGRGPDMHMRPHPPWEAAPAYRAVQTPMRASRGDQPGAQCGKGDARARKGDYRRARGLTPLQVVPAGRNPEARALTRGASGWRSTRRTNGEAVESANQGARPANKGAIVRSMNALVQRPLRRPHRAKTLPSGCGAATDPQRR